MGFIEKRADDIREGHDNELIERVMSAMARVIERNGTQIDISSTPTTINLSICPLCGSIIGDELLHARVHFGHPDMQRALLDTLQKTNQGES